MKNEQPVERKADLDGVPLYGGSLYGDTPISGFALLNPRRLLRKWPILVLSLIFALVAAFGYLRNAEKQYVATSLIEVSVRRPRIMAQQAAIIDDQISVQQSSEIFNTRIEKLKGRTQLIAALNRLDKALPGAFDPPSPVSTDSPEVRKEKRLDRFGKSMTISLVRRSRLILVEFKHSDPEIAAAACNSFADAAEVSAYEENRTSSDAAVIWLESQAALQRTELLKAEDALLAYRQEHRIDALESQRKTVEDALRETNLALVEAELERTRLLNTLTPKHPEVLAKTEQIQTLQRVKNEKIQLTSEMEMQIVERRTRQSALERSRDAADQAYRGVLSRIQEARIAADENTVTAKIIERATVPRKPVHPDPLRILALALLLGFAGGLGLLVATDFLEDCVSGPEDLENRGVPILAVVPHVRKADRASIATAAIRHHFSEVVEAFVGLGTILDLPNYKERSQVILVASSIPGEGKTVTSCNLAVILAKKNRRVLLVDFDMRRPQLAAIFPVPPGHPDLLHLQSGGEEQLAGLPCPVADCPNLDVIVSRPMTEHNPGMQLGALVKNLTVWARTKYDYIVLDAPPLGVVSDALAIAPLADMTLVMTRSEVSRKRLVWHTLNRFRESGIHNIGLVVNDFDASKNRCGIYSPYGSYSQYYQAYAPVAANEKPADAGSDVTQTRRTKNRKSTKV
ncbi:MAG: AAA family ATPase [Pontiellaceae bacterium]|jgi:tyrosine-protein kinase Etk/Wzc|nr:AAA family ATPase [Pontiellaceae bacterium]